MVRIISLIERAKLEVSMMPTYIYIAYMSIVINITVLLFCVLSVLPSFLTIFAFNNPVEFYFAVTEEVRSEFVPLSKLKRLISEKRDGKQRRNAGSRNKFVDHVNCRCVLRKDSEK